MATLKVVPIKVKSIDGNPVEITGISPTDHDCIAGTITLPGQGPKKAEWNLSGLMRDGSDPCNLDMRSGELAELARLARQLGAK